MGAGNNSHLVSHDGNYLLWNTRFDMFIFMLQMNPDWFCEGDFGSPAGGTHLGPSWNDSICILTFHSPSTKLNLTHLAKVILGPRLAELISVSSWNESNASWHFHFALQNDLSWCKMTLESHFVTIQIDCRNGNDFWIPTLPIETKGYIKCDVYYIIDANVSQV